MNVAQLGSVRDQIIKLINNSPHKKLTLSQILTNYRDTYLVDFPFAEHGFQHIHDFIKSIDGVDWGRENYEIIYFFKNNAVTSKTSTTPKRKMDTTDGPVSSTPSKRSRSAPDNDKHEEKKENIPTERGRPQVRFSDQTESVPVTRSKSDHRPKKPASEIVTFQNCALIGDDFLLGFAMRESHMKPVKENGILQLGLCYSGLTIADATEKLKEFKGPRLNKAIVYLGSFDILNGRELIELMNDFEKFAEVCKKKKIKAVICTLAPLAFNADDGNRRATLEGFNKYLVNQPSLSVININRIFCGIKKGEYFNYNCYMDHRPVSGCKKQVSLWSPFGIQEFRKMILKNVGFALINDRSVCM